MKKHLLTIIANLEVEHDKTCEQWEFACERDDPKHEIDERLAHINALVIAIHALKEKLTTL